MKVIAKFRCDSVRKYRTMRWEDGKALIGFLYEYEMSPVTSSDTEENKKFFASTPSGSLKMSAVADNLFEPGEFYYLEFTPALVPA